MLRFAYGCTPSLMSLSLANALVRRAGLTPACIVLSSGGLRFQKKSYTPAQLLPLFLKRFGPRFTSYSVLAGLGGALPFDMPRQGLMGFQALSRAHDISLLVSDDFSGEATLAALQRRDVALFVTCMCDQLIREPLLSLPRHGCVNIHPSLLPEFRGVDSIFQAMLHGEQDIGTTLHRTAARIDAGDVLAQSTLARAATDSHMVLTVKSTAAGLPLLKEHLEALERGETPASRPIDISTARHPYRSWPEREELRRFHAQGNVFWRASDFRRVLAFEDFNAG